MYGWCWRLAADLELCAAAYCQRKSSREQGLMMTPFAMPLAGGSLIFVGFGVTWFFVLSYSHCTRQGSHQRDPVAVLQLAKER